MTRLTLLVFFIAFSKLLTAQVNDGSISGKITDGGDQKIIDAATVSLFKAKDSVLFKIGLTDKTGNFLFEHVPYGKYYILATSTGHLQTYSSMLEINNSSVVPAGTLQLKSAVKTLHINTLPGDRMKTGRLFTFPRSLFGLPAKASGEKQVPIRGPPVEF